MTTPPIRYTPIKGWQAKKVRLQTTLKTVPNGYWYECHLSGLQNLPVELRSRVVVQAMGQDYYAGPKFSCDPDGNFSTDQLPYGIEWEEFHNDPDMVNLLNPLREYSTNIESLLKDWEEQYSTPLPWGGKKIPRGNRSVDGCYFQHVESSSVHQFWVRNKLEFVYCINGVTRKIEVVEKKGGALLFYLGKAYIGHPTRGNYKENKLSVKIPREQLETYSNLEQVLEPLIRYIADLADRIQFYPPRTCPGSPEVDLWPVTPLFPLVGRGSYWAPGEMDCGSGRAVACGYTLQDFSEIRVLN